MEISHFLKPGLISFFLTKFHFKRFFFGFVVAGGGFLSFATHRLVVIKNEMDSFSSYLFCPKIF